MKSLISLTTLRRISAILIITILFNAAFIGIISGVDNESSSETSSKNKIKLYYTFSNPVISQENGYDVISIPGLELYSIPTEPEIPFKTAKILIPPDMDVDEIEVSPSSKIYLSGIFNIKFGLEPIPIIPNPPDIETYPDPDIYGSDEPFPGHLYETLSVESFRGYKILLVNLFPVQYIPVLGSVYYFNEFKVTVSLTPTSTPVPLDPAIKVPIYRNSNVDELEVMSRIDNAETVESYRLWGANAPKPLNDPLAPTWEYLIITNDILNSSTEDYNLQDLASARTSQGLNAKIILVENITTNPAFWDPNPTFNDTQAQIRNAIKYYYNNWGTEYVLLAGDGDGKDVGGESGDNIIPARGFSAAGDTNVPSDLYYSCLSGNWNNDGDSEWGELGEQDLYAEVYVGRAAVDSTTELHHFVNKTLYYESTVHLYLYNVLMVGEHLWSGPDTWGGDYKDEIKNGASTNGYTTVGVPSFYTMDTLYDKDGTWAKSAVIAKINANVHIINHLGHSNINYNMKMGNADADALYNDQPFFGYSQGCYPGSFDNRGTGSSDYKSYDCIVEHFIAQPEGAFAFVGNSRYGYGVKGGTNGPSQHFDRQFFDALYGENMRELGKANHDSKEDNNGKFSGSGIIRFCYYETNLFGDPALKIRNPAPPPHEIKVENLNAPDYAIPGNTIYVTADINNTGSSTENNVEVNFTVDGLVNQTFNITTLPSGTSTMVNFSWVPPGGIYEVGIEATPVAGEFYPLNNKETKTVIAEPDLAVTSLEVEPFIITGQKVLINGNITNKGKTTASSISVKLKIDTVEVNSTTISTLLSGSSQAVSMGWTPVNNGSYAVSIYVDPQSGESLTSNNELELDTYAWPKLAKKIVILDSGGADSPPPSWNTLNTNWMSYGDTPIVIDYETFNYEGIAYAHLKQEKPDVLVISCAIDSTTGEFTDPEVMEIEKYIKEGHGFITTDASLYYSYPNNNKFAQLFGVKDQEYDYHWAGPSNFNILNTSHPLFNSISNPYDPAFTGSSIPKGDSTWDSADLAGGTLVALGNGGGDGAIIAHRGLVFISNWPEYNSNTADLQLLYNAMVWSKYQIYDHDIKVEKINLVDQVDGKAAVGKSAMINVTVMNHGKNPENNIQVKFNVNGIQQSTQQITSLPVDSSKNLSFQWTPNVAGEYDIGFEAVPVTDEMYTFDNIKNDTITAIAQPNLWINPTKFDVTLNPNQQDSQTLTLGNAGLLDLDYKIIDHPKLVEDFSSISFDTSIWTTIAGTPDINDRASAEPSAPYSLNLDGSGDSVTSKAIDLSEATDGYFHFYYERGGNGDAPEMLNELYIEYYTVNLDWVLLWWESGTGVCNDTFEYVSVQLPQNALHGQFKIRISTLLDEPGKDDYFIDNIYINCTTDQDWLTVGTKSGKVSTAGDADIDIDFDSSGLAMADYNEDILIDSNDPLESPKLIPALLRVRKDIDHIHMSTDFWEGKADEFATLSAIGHDEFHKPVVFEQHWSTTDPSGTVSNGIYNPGKVGTWKVYCNNSDNSVSNYTTVKVNHGILHHIKVKPEDKTITTDEYVQYTAYGCDSDNNEFKLTSPTWSLDNGGSINSTGWYSPDEVGQWIVKARYNEKTGQTKVTVTLGEIAQIKVTPETATLKVGQQIEFNASGVDAKGNKGPIIPTWNVSGGGGLEYTSGQPATFTAETAGTWTVYARVNNIVGTAIVTVLAGDLDKITINPSNCTIGVGSKKQFNAIGYDVNYNPVKIQVDWSVTGGGTISDTGLFTAKEIGTWTITASHSGISGTATVIVIEGILDHIIIDPSIHTMQAGTTKQFKAHGCDIEENIVEEDLDVEWELETTDNDDPVGIITSDGTLTAIIVGTWTLKATFSADKSALGEVTITPGILDRIKIAPANVTMNIDQTQVFTAIGYDVYDNVVNFEPTWETSGGGTVDGTGFTAEFTSIQAGAWELYAKYTLPDDSVVTGTAKIHIHPIKDSDGDGMPDDWELDHGLNPDNPNDAEDDSDYDYLTNLEEYLAGTDPTNPDSDGDDLPDGWEVANGLHPQDSSGNYGKLGDLDGDGYTNIQEYNARTDPDNVDSYPKSSKSDDETNGLESYLLFLIVIVIALVILISLVIIKKRGLPGEPSAVDAEIYQDSIDCPKCGRPISLPRSEDPTLHLTCRSCGAKGHLPNPNVEDASIDEDYIEPEEPDTGIDWDDERSVSDDEYYEVEEYDDDEVGEIDWD